MAEAEIERIKLKAQMSKRTTNIKRTRVKTSPSAKESQDLKSSQGQNKISKSSENNAAKELRSENEHLKTDHSKQ